MQSGLETIKAKMTEYQQAVSSAWQTAATDTSTQWTSIQTSVTKVLTSLGTSFSAKISEIKTTLSTGWAGVSTETGTVWKQIDTTITTALTGIKTARSEEESGKYFCCVCLHTFMFEDTS